MPTYVYQCKATHITESWQLLGERVPHVKCHTCGKRARQVITPVAGIVRNPAVPRRG